MSDLKFAFRQLLKNPGFTVVAVLTLALGIGACVSIFSVANAMLLRDRPYRDVKKSERQGIVADTLDRFGIVAKKDLFPSQLSGGQQQLVAVARAIVAKPSLILADEPTGNLHSDQGREIMELFRKLNGQGTTIVQVTHSETNAACGHRIIRLRDGWLVKD